ncbi:hypothetical protein FRE64_10230 [Euhalothece natronophila Z-M001]|uniref:Uncharacterized protein n=1 Tax=Euhalothece natronophila Z-M001 TaxID=522448 RepID=A0A5B8NMS0_9CHRO|nr:hypothetical protein FRE64_10230 [Euhalothece natronophila Z-M001]
MIPLIFTIIIALIAVYFYLNTKEEMLRIAAGFVAIMCVLSGLWFAPLAVKVLVVATPFIGEKLLHW